MELFFLDLQKKPAAERMLIAILINMIFFDVYMAYKPMSLLFIAVGYFYATEPEYEIEDDFEEERLKVV